MCADELNLTYPRIDREILREIRRRQSPAIAGDGELLHGKKKIAIFQTQGWPRLRRAAYENGQSVADLLEEALILVELQMSQVSAAAEVKFFESETRSARISFDSLERLPPGAPIKTKSQRKHLYSAINLLDRFQYWIFEHDRAYSLRPPFNPLGALTADRIEVILDQLETITLDEVMAQASYDKRIWSRSSSSPPPVRAPDAEPTRLPVSVEEVQTQADIEPNAVPQTNPIPGGEMPPLNRLVHDKAHPEEDITYEGIDRRGRRVSAQFSGALVKQFKAEEASTVDRLIRAILIADGEKSGVKFLPELGVGVVEVRTYINGHKRIFGCLVGRHLHLKLLMTIKDNVGHYSRRVPRNLCEFTVGTL